MISIIYIISIIISIISLCLYFKNKKFESYIVFCFSLLIFGLLSASSITKTCEYGELKTKIDYNFFGRPMKAQHFICNELNKHSYFYYEIYYPIKSLFN